jgi:AcrR family transcriptional regulator
MNMPETERDERTDRILDVAMELAELDGYDAVRLRDLAEKAEVALGTVYRRFGSKEDILAAALERLVHQFQQLIDFAPIPGDTPVERMDAFFALCTRAMADRPKLAAAMLRTVASGIPELAGRVLRYHASIQDILGVVLRGGRSDVPLTEEEDESCRLLQNLWFAEMVGWTGGLHDASVVEARMRAAARRLLA